MPGSCGWVGLNQAPRRASFWGEAFLECVGIGQGQEQIGRRVAESVSDNQFGGGGGAVGGALANCPRSAQGRGDEKPPGIAVPLDDEADPDGPLIGCARAAALGALLVRAPLAVLVAVTAAEGDHVPPPERAGAGADGGGRACLKLTSILNRQPQRRTRRRAKRRATQAVQGRGTESSRGGAGRSGAAAGECAPRG